jgi:hypothetical protein
VILSGIVRSWLDRHDAELAAWSEPAVTKVENRFVVAHPWPPHFSQNRPKLIWLAILTAVNASSAYCTYQAGLITWSRRPVAPTM